MKLFRKGELAKKIIITDGLPGCGKTMLSPIISSLSNVEMYYFASEIEFIARLNKLKKIPNNTSETLIRMLVDLKLYHMMMSREINFRPSDLSSVTNHHNYKNYIKRLRSPGDTLIPKKINKEKPILHLTTHDLLDCLNTVIKALDNRLYYIEVIRHPIDMINQQYWSIQNHFDNPRNVQVEFYYKKKPLPYFSYEWRDKFLKLNDIDKAIFAICNMINKNYKKRTNIKKKLKDRYFLIPFELFVINPEKYLKKISSKLNVKIDKNTYKEMKNQQVPRKFFFQTLSSQIYQKVGGHIKSGKSREDDIKKKINLFKSYGASKKYLDLLIETSKTYEAYIKLK